VFSDGALPPKQDPFLKQEEGKWKPHPSLILKSDGAANYTTTDLATLAFRLQTWQPDEIVYVTDGRQQLHFQQLFAIFPPLASRGQGKAGARLVRFHSSARTADPSKPAPAKQ